ncbi:MAG: hypothetical protein WC269_01015 [Candidatus Gracilibacteria bacterium]|jgi:hypothetical protein
MSVRKIKKYWQISLGIFSGVVISVILIAFDTATVFGVDDPGKSNWWDKTLATVEGVQWKDVFEVNPGKNIYKAIHNKILTTPYDKAMKAVSTKYGVSKEAAASIKNGSTLAASQAYASKTDLSQQEAINITTMFDDDFNNFLNVYQMQEDIYLEEGVKEIFSNNNIEDSGFDLVADLSIIEVILFNDVTEMTTGKPFPGAPDSPFSDDSSGGSGSDGGGSGDSVSGGGDGGGGDDTSDDTGVSSAGKSDVPDVKGNVASFSTGGGNVMNAEILNDDSCKVGTDPTKDALDQFNENIQNGGGSGNGNGGGNNGSSGDDDTGDDSSDDTGNDGNGGGSGNIVEVPEGSWGSTFCPPLNSGSPEEPMDPSSIPSFNGVPGTATAYESNGFSVSASICFSLELIKGKVAASKDLVSIKGEVDKINQTFDEFLNKSLVPNKVTGNMFEPAKCSKGLSMLTPEIKFIAYSMPVLTPPNDSLILKSNIFEKFDKALRSRDGWPWPLASNFEAQFNIHYPAPDLDQTQFIQNVRDYMAMATGDAKSLAEGEELANNIQTKITIADALLPEIQQFNDYFTNFKTLLDETYAGPCTSGTGGSTPLMSKEKE